MHEKSVFDNIENGFHIVRMAFNDLLINTDYDFKYRIKSHRNEHDIKKLNWYNLY